MNVRPSSLIRSIENGVITTAFFAGSTVARGATRVAHRASKFAHEVKIEVRARQLAAQMRDVHAMDEHFAAMTPAERAAFVVDQLHIARRAFELASKR